jgi:HPt (histidine-containing phosphotransfer) domain-containing protein/CheY-like chemotaxis protein
VDNNPAMKALVVDADSVGRRLAALLLQRLGFQPHELAEAAVTQPGVSYDLVLTTADGDSGDVASLHRAYPSARLIALISESCDAQRDVCLHAGADVVLSKPLALQALGEALCDSPDDFNVATWADLRQLFGASGVSRLVATLVDDLPVQRRDLEAALRNNDLQRLKKIAHTLGGVSAQLGASTLAAQWSQAEQAAAQGDAMTARRRTPELMLRHTALVQRVRDEPGGL